jgi:hypothetical protein
MKNLTMRHYLYNAFIIENDKVKIAIDPGRNLFCDLVSQTVC